MFSMIVVNNLLSASFEGWIYAMGFISVENCSETPIHHDLVMPLMGDLWNNESNSFILPFQQ